MKATAIGKLVSHLSGTPKGACMEIYAPSLRSLPEGSKLVMATLPVIDWNDCLSRDLRSLNKEASADVYAGLVMIDPFSCWEDLADLLKAAGITGVVNFPPASLIDRSTAGRPVDAGQELELRRMEWFASLGFKTLFTAGDDSQITAAERRLGSHLCGVIHLPEEVLNHAIGDEMELVSFKDEASSLPKYTLLEGTGSKPQGRNT